jgi:hypothetical protein
VLNVSQPARIEPSGAVDDILNLEIARGRSADSEVSRHFGQTHRAREL